MANLAPICVGNSGSGISNPGSINMPNIPPATDPQSTMDAVNALRAAFYNQQGGGPPDNGAPPQSGQANRPSPAPQVRRQPNPQKKGKNQSDFVEVARVTKKVKVTNPDDEDQYVIVNQIVKLVFQNPVTGETWEWEQGPVPLNPSAA